MLSGDPDRLQQVLWNLLSNAVKFSDKGSQVSVNLANGGSLAEITISDEGAGITPEFLPHIFETFTQADPSITRRHGGLGLGLAIARHLVELHGGTVQAENGPEGAGARFTVNLPLQQAAAQEDSFAGPESLGEPRKNPTANGQGSQLRGGSAPAGRG